MSVGYANYSDILTIRGTANAKYQAYTITYELNGGTNPEDTITEFTLTDEYLLPIPTKTGCEFKGWYDNANFTGSPFTTTSSFDSDITLYAKWFSDDQSIVYVFGDNLEFDKDIYIDTDIPLFSSNNIDKDFEVTFDIDENTFLENQSNNYNTFVNCVDHDNTPYHGFLFRRNSSNYILKRTTTPSTTAEITYNPSTIHSLHFVRKDNKLYADYNNTSNLEQVGDFTNLARKFNYSLIFGADIGSGQYNRFLKGTLSNATVSISYDNAESITLPNPFRVGYQFEGWYSDPQFTNKIGNGGASYQVNSNQYLYAKFSKMEIPDEEEAEEYIYNGEYTFDGNNYIDTKMYLYSKQNISRNFEMSFNVVNLGANGNNATLMSNVKNILQVSNASKKLLSLDTYSNSSSSVKNIPTPISNVRIMRINNILYCSFNGNNFIKLNNYNNYKTYSVYPLIFGADINSTGDIYRYFKGTLSDIKVRFIDDNVSIEDYNRTKGELKVAYQSDEPITFDGTNYINTNIKLFDIYNYDKDFEISFDIDSVAENNQSLSTIINSKYETSPYPGFVYRITANKTLMLTAAGATGSPKENAVSAIQSVKISRRNSKIYIKINDENEVQAYDFSDFFNFFETPVTIGSSLNTSGNPMRYFKGTLSNIIIKIEE